jgi:DNA-directed RNA polymerase subunit RPC12/RpoP
MKTLITLAQHTSDMLNSNSKKAKPNGIACPKCESELLDTNPIEVLTSLPPKKHIACPKCDFRGYRFC